MKKATYAIRNCGVKNRTIKANLWKKYTPDDIGMAYYNLIAFLHLARVGPVEVLAKGSLQRGKIKPSKMEVAPQGCLKITNKKTTNQIN